MVANLRLAVDDGWGEKKKTVWIDVTLWEAKAELAQKSLCKGDRIAITGRLSAEEWTDKKSGETRTKIKVAGEQMTFIEAPKNQNKREEF